MEKGVSTIIAIILLVIIVVAIVSMLWLFASSLFTSTTAAGTASVENTTIRMMGCLRIVDVDSKTGNLILRNCGTVPLSNCNVFVNDVIKMPYNNVLYPNGIDTINLGLTAGVYKVFVVCDNAQSIAKVVGIVGTESPQWFDSYVNSTSAGKPTAFSLKWNDNSGLSGYIFQFCNGTWNGNNCIVSSSLPQYISDSTLVSGSSFEEARSICKDGAGNLHVVWRYDLTTVRYANSPDGINWNVNNSFINGTLGDTRDGAHISCDGNNITVGYEKERNITQIAISTDNGASCIWESPGSIGIDWDVEPERRGQRIYLVYDAGNTLVFLNSTDGGSTWGTITTIMSGGVDYPSFAVNGNGSSTDRLYVSVLNLTDNNIYFINSTDAGAAWGTPIKIISNGGSKVYSSITFNGSNLYVVADDRTNYRVYFTNSTDSGITWTTDYRLDKSSNNRAFRPSITIDNKGYPLVFWEQNDTNVNYDIIYLSYNGTAWGDSVTYLTNNNLGNQFVNAPYTYYGDNKIHYMRRNGTSSLYQIMYNFVNLNGWINDTWQPMTGATDWSNVTKVITSQVGSKIAWAVYVNDTKNIWGASSIFTFTTT